MKSGPFEVTLFNRRDNSTFQERRVNGIDYFVAVPGEEYTVHVKVDDTYELLQQGKWLTASMKIDGHYVGISYYVYEDRYVVFEGYLMSNILAFKFDLPKETNLRQDPADDNIGFITLELGLALESAFNGHRNIPNFQQKSVTSGDKKFWQTASSCTSLGRYIGEDNAVIFEFFDVLATAKFPYHTAATLDLLEHIDEKITPVANNDVKKEVKKEVKKVENNKKDVVEVAAKDGRKINGIDLTMENEVNINKRLKQF